MLRLLLVVALIAAALVLERKAGLVEGESRWRKLGIDTPNTLVDAWERYYASQGIKFGGVVFAQYTWETANGKSKIFRENHNGYGMKYRRVMKGETQYAIGVKNGHAWYKNHAASVLDYAQWQRRLLSEHPEVVTEEQYLALLDDYNVSWCPDCRYAEDRTYTQKIKARLRELRGLR